MSSFRSYSPPCSAYGAGLVLLLCLLSFAPQLTADPVRQAEHAVLYLAKQYDSEGFDFRSDIWERELAPDIGKAVRLQLFKGNDYRVCVAVPPRSGVEIEAHVLDGHGKPIENLLQTTEGSWGAVLHLKPPATGVYMFTVRRSGGLEQAVPCAMITGFK